MRAHEVMNMNAESRRAGTKKKEISEVAIRPAENGGHTVSHRFEHSDGGYHEPEEHVFGKGEHEKMLAHVANALKLPEPAEHDPHEEEDESAAD